MKLRAFILASTLCMAGFPLAAFAGAAPEEAMSVLQKRGYTSVEIAPGEAPGYHANACKSGTRYAIELDAKSNIVDVDPLGPCNGEGESTAAAPRPEPQGVSREKTQAAAPPPPEQHGQGDIKGESHAGPAIVHGPLFDDLYRRGYYDIRVIDSDDDEIEVLACREGRLYEIEIKRSGRIDDIDRKGSCRLPGQSDGGAHVDAPFVSVRTGPGDLDIDVQTPFAGVRFGQDSLSIRTPLGDFKLP